MNKRNRLSTGAGILLFLFSAGMLGISCFLCFSKDIWYDELFTIGFAKQTYSNLITLAAQDVHPPLYYLIIKLAIDITHIINPLADAVIVAKLVSLIPYALLLVLAMTWVRKRFGMLSGGLFSFFLLSMPNMSDYTVEIRMYSFGMLAVIMTGVFLYEIVLIKKQKLIYCVMLTISCTLACYFHYFAAVAAAGVCIFFLIYLVYIKVFCKQEITNSLKKLLLCGVAACILYLPWVGVVIRQVNAVNSNYWIQPLNWRSLGGCVKFIFKPGFSEEVVNIIFAVVLAVIATLLIIDCLTALIKHEESENITAQIFAAGAVSALIFVVIFGFAASFLLRPIFVYRYMIPALGLFWLGIAVLLGAFFQRHEKKTAYITGIMAVIIFFVCGIRTYRSFYGEEMWKRVQMKHTIEAVEIIQNEDKLVFNFDHTQAVVSQILSNESILYASSPEVLIQTMYPQLRGTGDTAEAVCQIKEWLGRGEKVYFLGSGNARDDIVAELEKEGITAEETDSCLLERYWFNLYQLDFIDE